MADARRIFKITVLNHIHLYVNYSLTWWMRASPSIIPMMYLICHLEGRQSVLEGFLFSNITAWNGRCTRGILKNILPNHG
jgi:hypothetical protein